LVSRLERSDGARWKVEEGAGELRRGRRGRRRRGGRLEEEDETRPGPTRTEVRAEFEPMVFSGTRAKEGKTACRQTYIA